MKVRYSPAAIAQIRRILAYISEDNPKAAISMSERLDELTALIAGHPEIGRITNQRNIRVFRLNPYPYLLFYRAHVRSESISILKVRHTSQAGDWRDGGR